MSPDDVTNYPVFSRAEIVSTMLGLMLGLFLAGLDQTIVATALPYIARDLNAWQSMGWIVTAYLVSSTAATPIYGRLSDLYGRRPVVLVSVAIFIGASVLCALSRTLPELRCRAGPARRRRRRPSLYGPRRHRRPCATARARALPGLFRWHNDHGERARADLGWILGPKTFLVVDLLDQSARRPRCLCPFEPSSCPTENPIPVRRRRLERCCSCCCGGDSHAHWHR